MLFRSRPDFRRSHATRMVGAVIASATCVALEQFFVCAGSRIVVWKLPVNPPASEPGGFFFSWELPVRDFPTTEFDKTPDAQTGARPIFKASPRWQSHIVRNRIRGEALKSLVLFQTLRRLALASERRVFKCHFTWRSFFSQNVITKGDGRAVSRGVRIFHSSRLVNLSWRRS